MGGTICHKVGAVDSQIMRSSDEEREQKNFAKEKNGAGESVKEGRGRQRGD